jgi:hypothetical protein|nr:MAG TPA: Rad52/22 family double-strand break repair protein [Caudoviricetes sp.]
MPKKEEESVVVRQDQLTLTTGKENFFNFEQLKKIRHSTPASMVYKRPAKGGRTWKYVKSADVILALNTTFGGFWDFSIITDEATALEMAVKTKSVVVRGRLTITNPSTGVSVTREQYGRKDVAFKKGTNEPMDFGNDMKAAASDALKKCASQFGLFNDIYRDNELVEIKIVSNEEKEESESTISEKVKRVIELNKK